jgi:hypothetical protein
MCWLLATTAEVDAAHAHAVELGLVVPCPPTDKPWSLREFLVRHPDETHVPHR